MPFFQVRRIRECGLSRQQRLALHRLEENVGRPVCLSELLVIHD
jgi:hypothetical protein